MHILTAGVPAIVQACLTRSFQAEGCRLQAADSADDVVSLARRHEFSVILINLQMPGSNGCELIRRLRTASIKIPIIAVSPSTRAEPRVAALAAGADDVVTVPIDSTELVARMQAVVRRAHGHSRPVLTAGPLAICLASRDVTVDGRAVKLTGKEAAMLEMLMLRKNVPLSKEVFLMHLYSATDDIPCDRIIDVFICKIRRKLAAAGVPDLIKTVWGRGYMISDTHPERDLPALPAMLPVQVKEFA